MSHHSDLSLPVPTGQRLPTIHYDHDFYKGMVDGSLSSARAVAPLIMNLLQPKSVVDVGCGVGTWLKAFFEQGVSDGLGIDGAYVDCSQLEIDSALFQSMDLSCPEPIERQFELAISLEVAEHLPDSSSKKFIEFLTSLAPAVLFSAAIPGQGGTNHINEQWPWYWERLFAEHGFTRIDAIRPQIWSNANVEWWYRQNMVLYIQEGPSCQHPLLLGQAKRERSEHRFMQMQLLRETLLIDLASRDVTAVSLKQLLRQLPRTFIRAIRRYATR